MATTCPNCKARLSCGCQTRKASDGAGVCTNCIGKYEAAKKARTVAANSKATQSTGK